MFWWGFARAKCAVDRVIWFACTHECSKIVLLLSRRVGVETGKRTLLTAAEFGKRIVDERNFGGCFCEETELMEDFHRAPSEVGMINDDMAAFSVRGRSFFNLDNRGILEQLLLNRHWFCRIGTG